MAQDHTSQRAWCVGGLGHRPTPADLVGCPCNEAIYMLQHFMTLVAQFLVPVAHCNQSHDSALERRRLSLAIMKSNGAIRITARDRETAECLTAMRLCIYLQPATSAGQVGVHTVTCSQWWGILYMLYIYAAYGVGHNIL